MSKVTLNNITGGYAAVDLLNENFDAIEAAFDNTLSRNGAVPNTWLANQDANHKRLLNVADPVDGKDAANKDYVINAQTDALQIAFDRAAYHVDQFTGDGSDTTFTLSVAPGIESNAQVYINGAYQNKNTFSVSGTTITFTEAPPLSASIEVFVVEPLQVATADAANIQYSPGSGAPQTTVEAKLRETVSVKDFGAVGDGVTDDTAAIQAALDTAHTVLLPQGTYKITSQLVFGLSCSGLIGEGMYHSVISKEFNGNAILCDANGAVIQHIGIEGNGATYTDGGIVPRGYNILIQHCRINDTADSPIKVAGAVGSNALAATYLRVDSCFLSPTNAATTYAIRSITADDSLRPTCRVFSNLSGGSSLVDFSGMNYAVLENSLGTIIKFDNNCSKIRITGNRFTNATSNIVIYGQSHNIDGNMWGFGSGYGLSIDTTAAAVYFGPNNLISVGGSSSSIANSVATGDPLFNNLHTELVSFPIGWYADITNPTFGNSSTYSYYKLSGRLCYATFGFLRGSTANPGSGTYSFQLPFKASVKSTGVVSIKSSSGTYYSAAFIVQGGSSVGYVYIDGFTAPFASTTVAISTGAQFDCTITYLVAPT